MTTNSKTMTLAEKQRETGLFVGALIKWLDGHLRPVNRAQLLVAVGELAAELGRPWPDQDLSERVLAKLNKRARRGQIWAEGTLGARLWASCAVPAVDIHWAQAEHEKAKKQQWREMAEARKAQARALTERQREALRTEREALLEAGRLAARERAQQERAATFAQASASGCGVVPPRRHNIFAGTYTQGFSAPARVGAMDFASCPSRGFRC